MGHDCDDDTDPDDHFAPLRGILSTLESEFPNDSTVCTAIEDATSTIDSAVEDIRDNQPPEPDDEHYDYPTQDSRGPGGDRDLFDDVDE